MAGVRWVSGRWLAVVGIVAQVTVLQACGFSGPHAQAYTGDDAVIATGVAIGPTNEAVTVGEFRDGGTFGEVTFNGRGSYIASSNPVGAVQWAGAFTSTGQVRVLDVAVDSGGAIYVAGEFSGQTDFDPGAGQLLVDAPSRSSVYVAKLNPDGTPVWVRHVGEGNPNRGLWVSSDINVALGPSGVVHIFGSFHGSGDFDPGPETVELWSDRDRPFGADSFIWTLDDAGDLVWVKQFFGSGSEAKDIDVDDLGNLYLIGAFGYPQGFSSGFPQTVTVDFDPGPGTRSLDAVDGVDGFIAKLDPDGELVWVDQLGTDSADDRWSSVVVGPTNVTAIGIVDPVRRIIRTFDGDGVVQWENTIESFASASFGERLAIAPDGSVYVGGSYFGTVDFDPGPGSLELTASPDRYEPFLVRYGSDGTPLAAHGFRVGQYGEVQDLAVNPASGEVTLIGNFGRYSVQDFVRGATIDADPGPGTVTLNGTPDKRSTFVLTLDAAGNLRSTAPAAVAGS
jgi:hypothetical protein